MTIISKSIFIVLLHEGRSNCVHPRPRGYFSDTQKPCTCAPAVVTKYLKRISGPLLDRIDIHIEVPRVDYEKLSGDRVGESSESIRARVQAARNIQQARFRNPESRLSNNGSSTEIVCNANMQVGEIRQFCELPDEEQSLMRAATCTARHRAVHEPAQFIGAGVSSPPQTGTHHRGSGGE